MIESADIVQSLPVMESFYTIQGEGFHQGKAAYFIRLAGCDVGCVWCDVKDSWDAGHHPKKSIAELKKESDRIDRAIAALEGMDSSPIAPKGRRLGRPPSNPNMRTAPTSKQTGHALTAEGRRRLSEAMKKRWAERR